MIDDDWYLVDRLVKGVGEMAKDGEDDGARQQGGERVRKTDDDGDDNYNGENHDNEGDGDGSRRQQGGVDVVSTKLIESTKNTDDVTDVWILGGDFIIVWTWWWEHPWQYCVETGENKKLVGWVFMSQDETKSVWTPCYMRSTL